MTHATLKAELVGDTQIRFLRSFRASPQRVWDAHWDAELVARWMTGPEGWTMEECEVEAFVGGEIRFRWVNADGQGFAMHGRVVELDEPRRSVHGEQFEFPGATATTCETTFHPEGNGTLVELVVTYTSKEAREAALATGMVEGMEMSYARIDEL